MNSGNKLSSTLFFALAAITALSGTALSGCKDRAEEARQEARREAAADNARRQAAIPAAEKVLPPVPNRRRIPCEQLVSPDAYTAALGEPAPLELKDVSSTNGDATSTCSLVRGGVPPTEAEQKALVKKNGRLGVLPGDEICRVAAYCWTLETEERVRNKCSEMKREDDDSTGGYACVQIVPTGIDDVKAFRLYDEDTKCVIDVKGGPSLVDNELIAKCAKQARDSITPASLADNGAAPAADGSGAGSN
jgi:hypothetical protein